MVNTIIQVAIGGALGAMARFLTGVAVLRFVGPGFPWATMCVNVLGSFLMGVFAVIFLHTGHRAAPFLLTGLLGGFTTFSAFSLDALTLIERGQGGQAAAYIGASVALSIGALIAGVLITRALV